MEEKDRRPELMEQKSVIFEKVFGGAWQRLPPVLRQHYANRAYSADRVTVKGVMQVELSPLAKILSPFMRITGALVPHDGRDVPVTVHFDSDRADNAFRFNRIFQFPGKKPYHFRSRMVPIGGNQVIEYMRGLGWHAAYTFDGSKVRLTHIGYRLKLWGKSIPLPFEILMGKGMPRKKLSATPGFACIWKSGMRCGAGFMPIAASSKSRK